MLGPIYNIRFPLLILITALSPSPLLAQGTLVNINTALVTELQTLNGIGAVKAQAIVDYRTQNGLFQNIEDIKNVSGIGDATFLNIKDRITVEVASPTPTPTPPTPPPNSTPLLPSPSPNLPSSSSAKKLEVMSIGIGKDRLVTVGSPTDFRADTSLNYTRNSIFKWNFGDGTIGAGDAITHTYDYPGEYTVVLSVDAPYGIGRAMVKVKVVDPELTILRADKYRIEIKNNSKFEISLFGRALVSSGKSFVFPQDTLIGPGGSISFSSKITALYPQSSHDVAQLVLGESKLEEKRKENIARIEREIESLKSQVANVAPIFPKIEAAQNEPSQEIEEEEVIVPELQTASVKKGWLQILKRFFLGKNEK